MFYKWQYPPGTTGRLAPCRWAVRQSRRCNCPFLQNMGFIEKNKKIKKRSVNWLDQVWILRLFCTVCFFSTVHNSCVFTGQCEKENLKVQITANQTIYMTESLTAGLTHPWDFSRLVELNKNWTAFIPLIRSLNGERWTKSKFWTINAERKIWEKIRLAFRQKKPFKFYVLAGFFKEIWPAST